MRSPVLNVVAVVSILVLGAACQRRRTPPDTLVVVIESAVRDLDPRYAVTNYDVKISRLVAPGLTSTDHRTLEPQLYLAERIDRVGDLVWEAVLRTDARFSDGTPVTAADVAFTYTTTMDPRMGSLYQRGMTERFRKVEAVGERRVRFHLREPLATLFIDLDFGIVSARAASADGRFAKGRVIGAGPYRISRYGLDRIYLERNPHYHGTAPPTPRLLVRTVRDTGARALMLVGGSADVVQNSIRVDLVDEVASRGVALVRGPSTLLSYLMMNHENRYLADVRVRRAIAHAIDRERIIAAKFHGYAVLATGLIPPSHWAYHGQVARYPFDPARAKKLLDEAGYPDPDGPGGEPRFRLVFKTSANQFRLAITRIMAAQLRDVGIDVEVRAFEFATFFDDIKKGRYDLGWMQTTDINDPDHCYSYFHSSRIPTAENPNFGNRWRYRNPRVDRLTERGRLELDRSKRLPIYAQVQQQLAADVPIVPLWHEDNIALVSPRVSGYQVMPNARLSGLARTRKR